MPQHKLQDMLFDAGRLVALAKVGKVPCTYPFGEKHGPLTEWSSFILKHSLTLFLAAYPADLIDGRFRYRDEEAYLMAVLKLCGDLICLIAGLEPIARERLEELLVDWHDPDSGDAISASIMDLLSSISSKIDEDEEFDECATDDEKQLKQRMATDLSTRAVTQLLKLPELF